MTEAEAQAQLERMVAADLEPQLTEADLDALLAANRRPDSEGRVPTDVGWVPTWDLSSAAADGWERKAGLAASLPAFSIDGQSVSRHQIQAMCVTMARLHRRGSASTPVRSGVVE